MLGPLLTVFMFGFQGDTEILHGLPVSPLCDRAVTLIPESQLGKNRSAVTELISGLTLRFTLSRAFEDWGGAMGGGGGGEFKATLTHIRGRLTISLTGQHTCFELPTRLPFGDVP